MAHQDSPRVDVIIPAYNRARLLPRAINSVFRQTRADVCDITVIDDGSTDNTAEVVAGYGDRVRYLRQSNRGAGAARNAGIRATHHPLVAFLDSDDEWFPDKIERQLEALARWPEVVLVAGRGNRRYGRSRTVPHPVDDFPRDVPTDLAPFLFHQNVMSTPSVVVRRNVLEEVGGFCETLSRSQDYHLWTRLACRGPCVFLDATVVTWSADTPEGLQQDRDKALRAHLRARQLLRRELRRRPDCYEIWKRGVVRQLSDLRDRYFRRRRFATSAWYGVLTLWTDPRRPLWEWRRPVEAVCRILIGPRRHEQPLARI